MSENTEEKFVLDLEMLDKVAGGTEGFVGPKSKYKQDKNGNNLPLNARCTECGETENLILFSSGVVDDNEIFLFNCGTCKMPGIAWIPHIVIGKPSL